MIESRVLELRAPRLPPLRLPVVVLREETSGDWVTQRSGDLVLQVARDGTGAQLLRSKNVVSVIAPLLQVDSEIPEMNLTEDGETLRLDGDGVSAQMQLENGELHIAIRSERLCVSWLGTISIVSIARISRMDPLRCSGFTASISWLIRVIRSRSE